VARDDLQQRLERLPLGHPSSPFNDNGTRKPPPPRPQELPLPDDLPDEARQSLADDPRSPPERLTADQFNEHVQRVRARLDEARAQGLATHEQHTIDPDGETWSKERIVEQKAIIEALYDRAAEVPNDRQAVIAGGLPGAGKTTILESYAGIDRSQFFAIDPDQIKEEMAHRRMIPPLEGLSPMEGSDLAHHESSDISKGLAHRAQADGKNLIWDISMSSSASTSRRIDDLRAAGYTHIRGIFVDIPVDTSIERANVRHQAGLEEYREGKGYGGRYMPHELIADQADDKWGSVNRRNFEELKVRFDSWAIYDNSTYGQAPKLIDSADTQKRPQ
jgi:predicted ABC-type ATPase